MQHKQLYGDSLYANMPLNLTAELVSFLKHQSKLDAPKYLITPINGTKNTVILKTDPTFSTATTSLSSSSTSGSDQNTNKHSNTIFQPYHLLQPLSNVNTSGRHLFLV